MRPATDGRRRARPGRFALGAAVAVIVLGSAGCTSADPGQERAAQVLAERPSGADVCFVRMMVPHHEQAVEMSRILLAKDGVSARGRRFAEYVELAQAQEVTTMTAWLAAWDEALADADAQLTAGGSGPRRPDGVVASDDATPGSTGSGTTGTVPGGHAGHAGNARPEAGASPSSGLPDCGDDDHAAMPGMLAEAEIDRLRTARGGAAEQRYLELMVPHHKGALEMAHAALDGVPDARVSNEYVVSVARHVVVEQEKEIVSLHRMLGALDRAAAS